MWGYFISVTQSLAATGAIALTVSAWRKRILFLSFFVPLATLGFSSTVVLFVWNCVIVAIVGNAYRLLGSNDALIVDQFLSRQQFGFLDVCLPSAAASYLIVIYLLSRPKDLPAMKEIRIQFIRHEPPPGDASASEQGAAILPPLTPE